jgi:hypothetical protein
LPDHWQQTLRDALRILLRMCDNETHTSAWCAV